MSALSGYQNKPIIRTLRLTLKKEWFDMITSGVKKEEYREIKPYWVSRLTKKLPWGHGAKEFDFVEFTNGYGDHRPRITFEWTSTQIAAGKPEWGGDENYNQFVITLGREISRQNIK